MEKEKSGRVDGQRDGGLKNRFKGTGGTMNVVKGTDTMERHRS